MNDVIKPLPDPNPTLTPINKVSGSALKAATAVIKEKRIGDFLASPDGVDTKYRIDIYEKSINDAVKARVFKYGNTVLYTHDHNTPLTPADQDAIESALATALQNLHSTK
jgi:hypothetical protein